MKEYPSIPATIQQGLPVHAFRKIDGSNIRAEWSNKRGFYKFGSRSRLLGTDQPIINKAEGLIRRQEEQVERICKRNRWERIILFYEFAGEKSRYGYHEEDDDHKVWLIDANPYKKGILQPKEFLEHFSEMSCAELLYRGNCNSEFIQSVKDGTLEGMGSEGVVCKAKGKGNMITMFKIKCEEWYAGLHEFCKGDERLFELLK